MASTIAAALAVCVATFAAAGGTDVHAAQGQQQTAAQPRTGAQVFAATCLACHQSQGEGTEAYPPLAGSEFVTGPDTRLVRIVLHGLTGEIEVEGQTFSGLMPGWGPALTDADVAAVTTWIRSSWGNKAPPVTVATVTQIRAAHAARTTPWTVAELAKILPVEKR